MLVRSHLNFTEKNRSPPRQASPSQSGWTRSPFSFSFSENPFSFHPNKQPQQTQFHFLGFWVFRANFSGDFRVPPICFPIVERWIYDQGEWVRHRKVAEENGRAAGGIGHKRKLGPPSRSDGLRHSFPLLHVSGNRVL